MKKGQLGMNSAYKNLKIRAKLVIGFCIVIALTLILSAFGIYNINSINSRYENLLNFSASRLEQALTLKTHVMDIRRITTAINAYSGDAERQAGYRTESQQAVDTVNTIADAYIGLVNGDASLDEQTRVDLAAKASSLKTVLANYKKDLIDPNIASALVNDKTAIVENATRNAPVIAELGATVDELVTYEQQLSADIETAARSSVARTSIFFLAITAAIAFLGLFTAFFISGLIGKPLTLMSNFLKTASSTGDIYLKDEDVQYIGKYSQSQDEIGQCVGSCAAFVSRIMDVSKTLEVIAEGDLTAELNLLSEKDTMGLSLQKMLAGLNNLFGGIHSSTTQVSTAAKQISDGAQMLATGSTEQATVVEQLSTSISHIADKTHHNAEIAGEAAQLSSDIKQNAEKGSRQMESMMQAVQEINDASGQIEKVIKVIDDIAFQTNILALNAAVEAARAGQHGKGFAVVAEEVRNLAGKSAAAARETGGLIENSVSKANLGLSIATETSSSLKEIVEGINRSADIVAQIAFSSEEQAAAITQINTGIEQVTHVVQQNSATAEQSAAASEEMSGQTDMLETLIGQFKLKDAAPRLSGPAAKSFAANPLPLNNDFGKY